MPLFVLHCLDHPGSLALRQSLRPDHLAYIRAAGSTVMQAGPLLNLEGNPAGSLLIIDAADLQAAERFAAGDPYAKGGLFAEVRLHGYRQVLPEG